MSTLFDLSALKIEALVIALKYPMRDDFAGRRQALIDSLRRELIALLREADKPGTPDVKIDDDGDLIIQYEHDSFHFRLEIGPELAGGRFRDLYEHVTAFAVVKAFTRIVISQLGLSDIDVFSIDYQNVFNLRSGTLIKNNIDVFKRNLMPGLHQALRPLVRDDTRFGRADFKAGWDCDDRHTCYLSVECPGNDKNTTVWGSLNLRTRDDIVVSGDADFIVRDIDQSYQLYCGPYAAFLQRLLNPAELDLERRRLRRSS